MAAQRDKYFFLNTDSKAIWRENKEIIKTLKRNDISIQLTLEIYDSAIFPVACNQFCILTDKDPDFL